MSDNIINLDGVDFTRSGVPLAESIKHNPRTVTSDLDYTKDEYKYIKPYLLQYLEKEVGTGELITTEDFTREGYWSIGSMLDQDAGIDCIYRTEDSRLYGLAIRMQWIKPDMNPFNTFTVRSSRSSGVDTELAKRMRAIEYDSIYPRYTAQFYLSEPRGSGKVLSGAICHTKDLIIASNTFGHFSKRTNTYDDNIFNVVDWLVMKDLEYNIHIF